jgi:hypothetical protein
MTKKNHAYCYAELPKAGLGNMLLIWARAAIFAHLNKLPLLVSGWSKIHIGPLLRRERDRRLYLDFFRQPHLAGRIKKVAILRTYKRVVEPELTHLLPVGAVDAKNLFVFNRLPHWSDYFKDIKDYREIVQGALTSMLVDKYRARLASLDVPVIGIHVRCGDFRELKPNEDFAKVGHVRTPLAFFCDLVERIREVHGGCLPVTVFSDGRDHELEGLLKMPQVYRAGQNAAIVDLLLLSQSKVIIPSPGSTFGYWSAFLSDAVILHHPDHLHEPIRSSETNQQYFEGSAARMYGELPSALKTNIENIPNKLSVKSSAL